MSRIEKLVAKVFGGQADANITFDEASSVLEHFGFVYDGGKGSHRVFRHSDGRKIVLPYHGDGVIKPYLVRQIRKATGGGNE
jgi:predicted RNA binding protein YcfA (HicA-like mRNA interferase family)